MSAPFVPNPKRAIETISWLNPGAPIYVEQMSSRGNANPKPKIYPANEVANAARFVAGNNGDDYQRNLYFLPNAEFLSGKRNKANLSAVRFLHVDLDCKDYPGDEKQQEERIIDLLYEAAVRPKGIPLPTMIWFTGGGFQAVWRLAEPISVESAEELNLSLLIALQGGEGTHDASRLLRMPYSVNWLNDKKRAAGREPKVAHLIHPMDFNAPPVSYAVEDFKVRRAKPETKLPTVPGAKADNLQDIEPLPLPDDLSDIIPLDPKWSEVIMTGKNPPDRNYGSRSEVMFAATLWMLGKGMAPGHVLSVITDPEIGISAHVLDNPSPLKYGKRQIQRALELLEMKRNGWPAVTDEGGPVPGVPENIRYAFAQLGIYAQRNLFTQTNEVAGYQLDGRDLNEIGDILWSVFSRELRFSANPDRIKRELTALAHEAQYHPVRDFLDGLTWDGVPRLDTWLATYTGADDTELNREFGSKFLIAGVRRIRQPGVKFDTMLVLEGAQGAGKSQLAALLAVKGEWFCGSLDLKSDDKTKAELLARAWIVEWQEMDGMNKTTSQALKKFLSTAVDLYRPAYARNASEFKRHCIILGTTNEASYLRDLTGNRRFWPVKVHRIELLKLEADMTQLWSEAAVRESQRESIVLSKHLWSDAARLQGDRMVEDDYADVLSDNFAGRVGKVSMDSIKRLLHLDPQRMFSGDSKRIKAAMAALGWEYGTHRLHDLSGHDQRPRKGFARLVEGESGVELIVSQEQGGAITIKAHALSQEPPF